MNKLTFIVLLLVISDKEIIQVVEKTIRLLNRNYAVIVIWFLYIQLYTSVYNWITNTWLIKAKSYRNNISNHWKYLC